MPLQGALRWTEPRRCRTHADDPMIKKNKKKTVGRSSFPVAVVKQSSSKNHRARKMHGEGERKTKLRKRDRKSTHLLDLPVSPALMGAYEDLLGPEGGGAAAEGP